jgi:hypothetical protein
MYLESLAILEKASFFLKIYQSLIFIKKSLNFLKNALKRLQNLSKCPTLMKKTSIYLEIFLKSLTLL